MRRVVLWVGAVIALLVIAVLALPFVVSLDRYRDRIAALLSESVGRPVTLGGIHLTILTGLGADIDRVVIHDLPEFQAEPLAAIQTAAVRVAFWPLLRRIVEVRRITLAAPELNIVTDAGGRLNLATLGTGPTTGGAPRPPSAVPPNAPAAALAGLALAALDIDHGRITYTDRSTPAARAWNISDLHLELRGVALGETARFLLRGRLHELDQPFEARGTLGPLSQALQPLVLAAELDLGPDLKMVLNGGREHDRLQVTARAGAWPLERIAALAQKLGPWPEGVTGRGPIAITVEVAAPPERMDVTASADLAHAEFSYHGDRVHGDIKVEARGGRAGTAPLAWVARATLRDVAFEPRSSSPYPLITGVTGVAVFANGLLRLESTHASALGGRVELSGHAGPFEGAAPFDVALHGDGLDANTTLTRFSSLRDVLFGRLKLDLTAKGRAGAWPDLSRSLTGDGAFALRDGRLTTADILDLALRSVGVTGAPTGGARDTTFSDFSGAFAIARRQIDLRTVRIVTGDYGLEGKGRVGLDQTLDLAAQLRLSERLAARFPQVARWIASDDGAVVLPLRIGGTVAAPTVTVPLKAIRKEVRKQVREKLKDTLERFLNR